LNLSRREFGRLLSGLALALVLLGSLTLGAASHAQSSSTLTIGGTPPGTAKVGQSYSFTPTTSDPSGGLRLYQVFSKPAWADFDNATGRLHGRPAAGDVGTYPHIEIWVANGQSFASLGPFSITVVGSNAPPSIGGTPDASVTAGTAYSFTPTASDADGDTLTFSIANKPVWASFSSSTGRLYGSPGSGRIGTYSNIVITASDGQASASLGPFSITVVGSNAPPSIGGTPDASVTAGTAYSFTPTASDADGDTLTFSIANKPVWASFSSSTGRLYGSPGSGRIGTYSNIVITASDGQASASLGPFSITVVGSNAPPSIGGTPDASVTAGTAYSFTPTASDADGDTLTFSIANKPVWASFSSSTGRLYGSPGSGRIGTYSNIVITASDGQASASLGPFSIEVVPTNAPPTISGTPPTSATVGKSYSFRPTASDPEDATLTFSIVNKPAWAGFASSTGRLYGTPGSGRVGTYSGIRISVSDGVSTVSLPEFSITVTPTEATGSATVSWTPPTTYVDGSTIKDLAGYLVVFGASPSDLSNEIEIPSPLITSAVIEALTPGVWYFAVKAYTTASIESDLSAIVYKSIN
jgi:predicted metalloprotease